MTKYLTFFVVAVVLGTSIAVAAPDLLHGNGPRAASSNERDAIPSPSVGSPQNAGNESMKAEQGFVAILVSTDKPQQFLDDWNTPGEVASVRSSRTAARGNPCVAFILFAGCGADQQGLADVVADIRLVAPDGKVLGQKKAVEICQKQPAPAGGQQQLGTGNMGIVLDANDPSGTYEFRAKVSDRVKGVVLELKSKFSVK